MTDRSAVKKLIIWGASGHALVVADAVRMMGGYELAGLLDDRDPGRRGTLSGGLPVLGGAETLDGLRRDGIDHLFFGFGDGAERLRLAAVVRSKGFSLPTVIHPRSVVARDVVIGAGTLIAAGAVVNPGVRIGENVIINTSSSVDHECVIDDGAHVCPGARLAGGISVGRRAWVGIGASVVERVRIGAGAYIGAGAVVIRDVPDNVVVVGVPARILRKEPNP